jgi:hypothetical protein
MMRSSISDFLAATAFVALIVWTGSPATQHGLARFVASLVLVACYSALSRRPNWDIRAPVASVLAYFAMSLICWWAAIWIGYFKHVPSQKLQPFFEDGLVVEGVLFPIGYFVVYSPIVAAVGAIASSTTLAIASRFFGALNSR